MSDNARDIDEIIVRYFNHTATQEEKTFLHEWLMQSKQNQDDFSQIREAWLLSGTNFDDDDQTEAALRKLKARVAGEQRVVRRPFWMLKPVRVAASIVLLVATALTFFLLGGAYSTPRVVVQNKLLTASDSRGRFVLPDSTVVWLNSNTTLQYPEEFAAATREVVLDGQAYFEVAKNKEKPFIVHAGEMEVEVLGTHFQVSNYSHKSSVEAVLVEGSVKVAGCGLENAVALEPGQLLKYSRRSGEANVSEVNTSNYTNWTNGRIRFDNTNLADIILNLEQWFATEITCDPQLAQSISVSFTVRIGDTLDEILESMSMVAPIKCRKTDGGIEIMPNN
ncbi:MAG: FecR family protein [Muribaculaceae bacterium]